MLPLEGPRRTLGTAGEPTFAPDSSEASATSAPVVWVVASWASDRGQELQPALGCRQPAAAGMQAGKSLAAPELRKVPESWAWSCGRAGGRAGAARGHLPALASDALTGAHWL